MAGNIAACVPGTSPRAGTGHLVHAQTDALAEIAARCREAGGGGQGISLSKSWDLSFKPFLDSCDFLLCPVISE